jgi:hypothetical protein
MVWKQPRPAGMALCIRWETQVQGRGAEHELPSPARLHCAFAIQRLTFSSFFPFILTRIGKSIPRVQLADQRTFEVDMSHHNEKPQSETTSKVDSSKIQFPPDYWDHLVQNTYDQEADPVLGEFDRLQRLNLTHLLNKIVNIKATLKHNETTTQVQMDLLREVMHHYGEQISQLIILCMGTNSTASRRNQGLQIHVRTPGTSRQCWIQAANGLGRCL